MVSDEGFIMAVVAVAAVIISWFAVKKINDKRLKQIVEMIGFLIAFVCIIISDLFDFIKY